MDQYGAESISRSPADMPAAAPLGGASGVGASPGAARGAALVLRLVARDEAALAELYDGFGAAVYGLVLTIVRSPGDAEEITQEVFLYAWEKADRFDAGRGTVTTWLLTLARSRAIDRIRQFQSQERRREGFRRELAVGDAPPQRLPDAAAERDQLRRGIHEALSGLVEEQRQVLELAYFEGLTQTQIAKRLTTPLGTVKTRMRQGMLRLRTSLASLHGLAELP